MSSSIYSYSSVLADLQDIAGAIGSSGLTSSQAASLTTLLQDTGNSDGTASYVYSILGSVVASGDAAGTTQTAFNSLIGQWFLGTDDPTPLPGPEMVSNAGASLFPTDMSTAYEYIDQGYYNGDCWLVASMIETAAVNPSLLQSMIWENANGSYGVRLCSTTGYVYVTVNSDLMSEDQSAYSTDGTIWAGLLEKAYVEADADGLTFSANASAGNSYEEVANGGWDQMLQALTGRRVNYYSTSSETALAAGGAVYDQILYDTENGLDVTFNCQTNTDYGLVSDHAFAVIGIDQSTGDYIFFNPWGYAEISNAEFEVTPQELNAISADSSLNEFMATDGSTYFNETILCHLAGTRILTPTGEQPIETLRIGDEVVTRFCGTQRIKWIGEQHYDGRFIARNKAKMPVKITAGALGADLPRRDLYLSPAHSVLLDGILVLAAELVNGVTITQDLPQGIVSYYNIELAAHDCVLAEGSWSETYADCSELRQSFHNAAGYWQLYPYAPAPAEPVLCAPRPRTGEVFTAALARVLSLAEARTRPGPALGYVDQIGAEITGWAFDPENPDLPVRLHVYAGPELIGLCFAHEERADVREAGFGSGRSGFRCRLPARTDPAGIMIRCAASGAILPAARGEARRA